MSRNLLIERLFELLISGDHLGARHLIEEAIDDGLTFQSLAEDAYMPLIRMVNALHRAEQLTNLAHDYATHILSSLVDDARQSSSVAAQRCETHEAGRPDGGEWVDRFRFCPAPPHSSPHTSPHTSLHTSPHTSLHTSPHASHSSHSSHASATQARESGHSSAGNSELRLALDEDEADAGPRAQFVFFSMRDQVLTARLTGPHVGEREVPIINTEINDILRTFGPRIGRLVLDLSDVRMMSSMALGMCLDVRRRAGAMGIKTTATGLSGEMTKVFRRLKIDGSGWRQRISGGVSGLLGRKVVVA